LINSERKTDKEIDTLLVKSFPLTSKELPRPLFVQLPHSVAREVLAAWLRNHELRDFNQDTLERLVVAGKTSKPGRVFPIIKNAYLEVRQGNLALQLPER
jgi:hypothetical protein